MTILDRVKSLKQVRPGDVLEPVKEWTKQFDDSAALIIDVETFFFDNQDVADIPHSLGRAIIGAVILGVLEDFETTGQGFSYTVRIETSTAQTFQIELDKPISGTVRFMVF